MARIELFANNAGHLAIRHGDHNFLDIELSPLGFSDLCNAIVDGTFEGTPEGDEGSLPEDGFDLIAWHDNGRIHIDLDDSQIGVAGCRCLGLGEG